MAFAVAQHLARMTERLAENASREHLGCSPRGDALPLPEHKDSANPGADFLDLVRDDTES